MAIREALGEEVADVRASDRLTDSAVCLVAFDNGPDRQFERLLSAADRIDSAAKPILEVNPGHAIVAALATVEEADLRADVAHLLLDTARVLDGERPTNASGFAERLSRVVARSLGKS